MRKFYYWSSPRGFANEGTYHLGPNDPNAPTGPASRVPRDTARRECRAALSASGAQRYKRRHGVGCYIDVTPACARALGL